MNKYVDLSFTFFKIGLFTFGGGLAMLPFMEKEMVEKRNWITNEEMTDIIAIAESTPGAIAVNASTFIGYKVGKFWGALLSTISLVIPSLVIIVIISLFIEQFLALKYVQYAFMGIRCAVALLILKAAISIYKKLAKTYLTYILMAIAIVVTLFIPSISSIYVIIFGGIVGLIEQLIRRKKDGDKEDTNHA